MTARLVDSSQLDNLASESGSRLVLLDVRYEVGRSDGEERYLEGHIPGAVFVDLETELAAPPSAEEGRHPLPTPEQLQRAAQRWGVTNESVVVMYDDWSSFAAARAWWLLVHAGLHDVRILDGGLSAWRDSGRPLEVGQRVVTPSSVELDWGNLRELRADDVEPFAAAGVLIDARARERYLGENEPIDSRAGHIPGAVNVPTSGNVDADGRFLSGDQLRSRFAAHGVTGEAAIGAYCGSGVTASHEIFALSLAGLPAALYAGSWSQWSGDPGRPISTSDEGVTAQ